MRFHCNSGSMKLPQVTSYVHCQSRFLIAIVGTTKRQILKDKAVLLYFHTCNPQRQATCYNTRHSQQMRGPFYIYAEYGNWQFWSSTCTQGSAARCLERYVSREGCSKPSLAESQFLYLRVETSHAVEGLVVCIQASLFAWSTSR